MTATPEMEAKIIEAAILCMEKYGFADTTVRKIAMEADVNIAAVNYYFGSKDELIERALQTTLVNAFDWDHFKQSENASSKERLCGILEHIGEGAQRYPEITRLHLFGRAFHTPGGNVFDKLNLFLEQIYDDLSARGTKKTGTALRFAILQSVFAVVFSLGLQNDLCNQFAQVDLTDPNQRKQYIKSLVDGVL